MRTKTHLLPQLRGQMFVTDGRVETHLIFNEGQDVPDMSVYLLNVSEAGRSKMREYYRADIPICQKAGQGFLFGLRVNASMMSHAELDNAPTLNTGIST